jgi:hypothetical protein
VNPEVKLKITIPSFVPYGSRLSRSEFSHQGSKVLRQVDAWRLCFRWKEGELMRFCRYQSSLSVPTNATYRAQTQAPSTENMFKDTWRAD